MRFLLIPLLALSTGTPAVARTWAETAPCVKVGDIEHRWMPPDDGSEYGDISLQIHVTSTCGRSEDMYFSIEMLDSDGFLVENTWTIRTIRPGPNTVRIKFLTKKTDADRIARYEVAVEPWEF